MAAINMNGYQDETPAPRQREPESVQNIMAAFFIGFLALAFSVFMLYGYDEVLRSRQWPAAEGRIAASYVVTSQVSTSSRSSRTDYCVENVYEYLVNNVKYRSSRTGILARYCSSSRETAQEHVLAGGQKVTVYYNPLKPQIAVISREEVPGYMLYYFPLLFIFGAGLIVLGVKEGIRRTMNARDRS